MAPGFSTKSVEALTKAFIENAQSGGLPWDSTEVEDWLKAATWWLLKASSENILLFSRSS